ncbi:hypothetical protein BH11PLA2_BH11PLA2_14450 [soil metagenome]
MRHLAPRVMSLLLVVSVAAIGCKSTRTARKECPTPATLGMNTRDMVDKQAQDEFDSLVDLKDYVARTDQMRKVAYEKGISERNPSAPPYRQKNILSLSGGGSFGAFTAGVLCGWTCCGGRPEFDVVTGISTGALLAPYAFLGSAYDPQLKAFYTTLEGKDLYKMKTIRGLFGESLADNSKLAAKVEESMSPQVICEIAQEHMKGRRLYIGTTAAESKQFVVWDIGPSPPRAARRTASSSSRFSSAPPRSPASSRRSTSTWMSTADASPNATSMAAFLRPSSCTRRTSLRSIVPRIRMPTSPGRTSTSLWPASCTRTSKKSNPRR